MRRLRRLLVLAAANLVLLALALAALELVASRFVERPEANLVSSFRLNHVWKPNSRLVHREWVRNNPRFPKPYVHTYNAQGWLDDEDVPREKPPGTFRIFYVGDSFVEGTAPMGASMPSRVERGLNERARGTGVRFQVVNTGTLSYSPLIAYVLIRYVLLDYQPDLVVVNVDMTDDYDDWKYARTAIWDEDGNPWAVPPRDVLASPFIETARGAVRATPLTRLQFFLYRHSYVYNLLLGWRGASPTRDAAPLAAARPASGDDALYPRWAWCQEEWDAATARNAGRTLDVLGRIARLAEAEGVPLVFTSTPHYEQYAGADDGTGPPAWSDRPHREVARVAREHGVPYLDAFAALAPRVRGTPRMRWYYAGNMHFNPDGYALWAEAQLAFLTDPRHGLLPAAFYERGQGAAS